jgi:hypothetical protein
MPLPSNYGNKIDSPPLVREAKNHHRVIDLENAKPSGFDWGAVQFPKIVNIKSKLSKC